MALQVLGVQVRLGAVRAREFAVSILNGDDGVLRAGRGGSRAARSARQNAATALGANNVSRSLSIGQYTVVRHAVGSARLGHHTRLRHRTQDRRSAAASGSNGLRVAARAGLHAVGLVRVGVLGHGVDARTTATLGALGVARRQVGRVGSVGSSRGARGVRVAAVHRLHRGSRGLQRREALRQRRLERGRRRVGVRRRGAVYAIGRVLGVIHGW